MNENNISHNISRIEELETKSAFQDHLIEELNQALIQQQNDIVKLKRIVENVISQIEKIGDPSSNLDQNELPPHY